MLAQRPVARVPVGAARRDHSAVAGADHLAWVERETGGIAMRLADPFPEPFPLDLAAARAGRVFDQRKIVAPGDRHDALQIARQSHLVDDQQCTRLLGDRRLDKSRVDVVGVRLDVDEDRRSAAVADAVGGGDVRVTDRDNLIARLHAGNQKGQVQCCRTVGDRTGVRRADHFGEFALEGGDLGALRDPATQDRTPRGLGLRFTHHRFGDRNHRCRLTAS